jgi:hypothetical protein
MTEQPAERDFSDTIVDDGNALARKVNEAASNYIILAGPLSNENFTAWAAGLVKVVTAATTVGVWQIATDAVAYELLNGERAGLNVDAETAAQVGEWILTWDRVSDG